MDLNLEKLLKIRMSKAAEGENVSRLEAKRFLPALLSVENYFPPLLTLFFMSGTYRRVPEVPP